MRLIVDPKNSMVLDQPGLVRVEASEVSFKRKRKRGTHASDSDGCSKNLRHSFQYLDVGVTPFRLDGKEDDHVLTLISPKHIFEGVETHGFTGVGARVVIRLKEHADESDESREAELTGSVSDQKELTACVTSIGALQSVHALQPEAQLSVLDRNTASKAN